VAVTDDAATGASEPPKEPPRQAKSLTIGAVCKALQTEFQDISISKIRYLEDQKLITPRRTPGGYRLYSAADVARLRTILRLQRDEYMPLAVIRQELASGRTVEDGNSDAPAKSDGRPSSPRRISVATRPGGVSYLLDELVEETGAEVRLIQELEDFGIVRGEVREGKRVYDETDREIVRAVRELAPYGVAGRNLRVFKSSAEREAQLLNQILAPALRSRNPERRREAMEALENLAAVASHLKHLLLVRDLRRIAQ
jgi:DNA-binding transcriptional MerR regulator